MRHRVAHRKLGRVTEHRLSLLRNQAQALLRHERISTTVAKAKELRPFVEHLITVAKRGIADGDDTIRAVNARRAVRRDVADRAVASKLFDTIAPRFADRPGGYTRLLRIGFRRGDAAEMAQVELIGSEYNPDLDKPKRERKSDENPERQPEEQSGGRLSRMFRGGKKRRESAS
jgi:large subunit ribosomal protein L17